MAGGSWDPTALPERAGLYINFLTAATQQIKGGARGTVAIPLKKYTGLAMPGKFFTVDSEKQAQDLFGADNVKSLTRALQAGAKDCLVYTLPKIDATNTEEIVYAAARDAFEARPFNVFVYDGIVSEAEQLAGLSWTKRNREEGKHYVIVFGCTSAADDLTPSIGDARSVKLTDKYALNLINGVILGGVSINSAEFAPYIAGLVAGTAINKSTTYAAIPVDDVTYRMRPSEIKASLKKGSFILMHDGEKVKVERGITTDLSKIRKVRAEQSIATDITRTGSDSYVGKLDNSDDGQKALIGAIKAYLEKLATNNVLVAESIVVELDPDRESKGDQVFLRIAFVEIDSMEEIYLTINVG
ncbi:phage tail sheath subtilisin-like domain-containing protein [Paenibacillus sp. 1P03SA]|uniref:phage tail sheath subtilisin-like domain-containing protein n=1 Tax=Paenibacillus sp. 1P03SA TaxID=3132294 RepID=UPI0039A19ED4